MSAAANQSENPPVVYEKRGRVAYITLNRPRTLNALDLATHAMLAAIWDDFEADNSVWLGVLTGAGERAFSVGQDLKELVVRTRAGTAPSTFGSKGASGYPRLTERFHLTKPIIARVDGYALGGGFELALACDIIVASERSTFALPEAGLGLIPGAGGLFRLMRQLPTKTAMGYLMTGRRISTERAYALGLVNDIVPASELDACVEGWVRDILRNSPMSVRAIKDVTQQSAHLSLEQAYQATYLHEQRRLGSHDCKEGPLAFVEKRAPVWRGE